MNATLKIAKSPSKRKSSSSRKRKRPRKQNHCQSAKFSGTRTEDMSLLFHFSCLPLLTSARHMSIDNVWPQNVTFFPPAAVFSSSSKTSTIFQAPSSFERFLFSTPTPKPLDASGCHCTWCQFGFLAPSVDCKKIIIYPNEEET